MCTDECAQRCFCDAGYIRDENTRTCVRIQDCPSCPSYCSANEVFNECASRCYIEPTCQNPNPVQPTICTKECAQRCFCDAGYIRDENTKTCVRIQDCPSCPSLCDPYTEVFNECASACQPEPTCQDPNPTSSQFCTLQCVQRCECAYGFIRDAVTKLCVPACECPVCPDECGPNKHMGCKPCCPESVETCQNTHPKPCNGYCTYECRPSCVCDVGFIRNEITDECVPRQQCPSSHKFHYHH
ncbi:unnamed protein product [Psylliodes chrysocephalus]|uniref:TIL domain-containing protein n=1 Tax=Psylliodes chrysocephalus TaxID=3402493 RepID=A0A9P0DBW6_9CUCU|nr:unnamed protein product [Psylliodes chrysocephala]